MFYECKYFQAKDISLNDVFDHPTYEYYCTKDGMTKELYTGRKCLNCSEFIMSGVNEHYKEALQHFSENSVVGIFLQGSQNYGLQVQNSDIDTKLIVLPSFEDIVFNMPPISTTHVRENNEHIDFKDLRLMLKTFRKQNLNFVEILFTPYFIINPIYEEEWNKLIKAREAIARYNPYVAVKTMKGISEEKFHAMKHEYPSKLLVLKEYGYDPKQLHHLLRVEEYLKRYIEGEPYQECLHSLSPEYLKQVKLGLYSLDEANKKADEAIEHIRTMANEFCSYTENSCNEEIDHLLNSVQYNIMEIHMKEELLKC